jgi:hypothetical protein
MVMANCRSEGIGTTSYVISLAARAVVESHRWTQMNWIARRDALVKEGPPDEIELALLMKRRYFADREQLSPLSSQLSLNVDGESFLLEEVGKQPKETVRIVSIRSEPAVVVRY